MRLVCKHFGSRLPVIGFCGAPFTLASYMIEGGGSRNYVHAKKMMYSSPAAWDELMRKLVAVVSEYAAEQVHAGADVIQIFDSWVGCLSVEDYRRYVLPRTTELVKALQKTGVPIIYFGTDSATLLPSMRETGAEVIGLDWRIPLDDGWRSLGFECAVQGNLDPVLLFADWKELKSRAEDILRRAAGRPGHIFNLGHGILPETPVENVKALAEFVQEHSAKVIPASRVRRLEIGRFKKKPPSCCLAHGSPDSVEEVPEFLLRVTGGRPLPPPVVEEVKHRYGLIGRSPLTELTLKQGELLARELGLPVYVGMRNWKPFIADAVRAMTSDGIEHAVAICLAPQNSRTSVGLYRSALASNQERSFHRRFRRVLARSSLLIRAFAEKLRAGWDRACREMGTQESPDYLYRAQRARAHHCRWRSL